MAYDLIQFDEKYVLEPRGLPNSTHIHCYWNSTLQALISCPQFISTIEKLLPGNENSIVGAIISFIRGEMTNMDLYKRYIVGLSAIGKSRTQLQELVSNQQCVGETLTYFLEIFEKSIDVMQLFEHRYVYDLICIDCKKKSRTISKNVMFELNPTSNIHHDIINTVDIIEDYKCEKCGEISKKPKYGRLAMIPEILIIIIKNYAWEDGAGRKQAKVSDFPEFMEIVPMNYRAIAYIDHYGRLDFGHYVSTCLRRRPDGNLGWFLFNDDQVTPTTYAPGPNTYMIIYTYYKP